MPSLKDKSTCYLVEPLRKNLTKFQNNATILLVNHAFLDADMTRKIDF